MGIGDWGLGMGLQLDGGWKISVIYFVSKAKERKFDG